MVGRVRSRLPRSRLLHKRRVQCVQARFDRERCVLCCARARVRGVSIQRWPTLTGHRELWLLKRARPLATRCSVLALQHVCVCPGCVTLFLLPGLGETDSAIANPIAMARRRANAATSSSTEQPTVFDLDGAASGTIKERDRFLARDSFRRAKAHRAAGGDERPLLLRSCIWSSWSACLDFLLTTRAHRGAPQKRPSRMVA